MATYAVAKAERDRLMAHTAGVSAAIREIPGGYELWLRDARQSGEQVDPFGFGWFPTTTVVSAAAYP